MAYGELKERYADSPLRNWGILKIELIQQDLHLRGNLYTSNNNLAISPLR